MRLILCIAVLYLSAPSEIRLERVKQRSYDKFGEGILPGSDMYEKEQRFFDFVVSRSMEKTEQWLKTLSCPVICADGTKAITDNVKWLTSEYSNIADGSEE